MSEDKNSVFKKTADKLSSRQIFSVMMWIEAGGLLFALVAIGFSGIELPIPGDSPFLSVVWGACGALFSFTAVVILTRSPTSFGCTLRGHCAQLTQLFSGISTTQIILLSIVAGICEEIFFRGFLQVWLSQLSSPLIGLLGASLIFAFLHWASFTYFLLTFVVGLVLGVAYQQTGSLLGVIIWHAVYDLLALMVLSKYPRMLGLEVPLDK
ncbi:CPBP family intramembrane glutamic endopeptidase [Microbulbifer variabilis]|uniref:CPBP family intramembrane glutamic endopeptidase n=1 Tax=Microbulbifer variabilis TaxID=266805 RepID=UPI00037838DC|nr:CPBP family intramembrane glutamic endopeptidase [Microbulbifer variabilis]